MKKSKKKPKKYDVAHRPIVIPKATMDALLKLPAKVRSNAIALYTFYYYTSIWQETNKCYATSKYIKGGDGIERKGLGWGKDKTIEVKKALRSIPLIEDVKSRPQGEGAGSSYGKNYIKVIFYHSAEASSLAEEQARTAELENQLKESRNQLKETKNLLKQAKNQLSGFQDSRGQAKNQLSGSQPTRKSTVLKTRHLNAYSSNKGNACSSNKRNASKDNTVVKKTDDGECLFEDSKDKIKKQNRFYYKRSIQLYNALKSKRKIFRKTDINKWSAQFKKLHVEDGIEKSKIKEVLNFYIKHIGEEYFYKAYSAKTFREKFDDIASAMEERQDPERENKPNYKPGDEQDDFEIETKEWTDKNGQRKGRDSIDYGEQEQDEDED